MHILRASLVEAQCPLLYIFSLSLPLLQKIHSNIITLVTLPAPAKSDGVLLPLHLHLLHFLHRLFTLLVYTWVSQRLVVCCKCYR